MIRFRVKQLNKESFKTSDTYIYSSNLLVDIIGFRGIHFQTKPPNQPRTTGLQYKLGPRFGVFCSCCCLPLLPELAGSILATWERPYRDSLYMYLKLWLMNSD